MTIIEALVRLRNDLKTWVANNLRTKADKTEVEATAARINADMAEALASKVSIDGDKVLSTNDFTNTDKALLSTLGGSVVLPDTIITYNSQSAYDNSLLTNSIVIGKKYIVTINDSAFTATAVPAGHTIGGSNMGLGTFTFNTDTLIDDKFLSTVDAQYLNMISFGGTSWSILTSFATADGQASISIVQVADTSVETDSVLDMESTNPIQNKVVAEALEAAAADVAEQFSKITHPVTSVNGKTGPVVLDYSDVGALPASTPIPSIEGLAATDYVEAKFAESVKTADIVDNLTTSDSTKPLSAEQGRLLNEAIKGITTDLGNLGGGDMLTATYDKDKNGVVDDSERLGGQLPGYYAKAAELAEVRAEIPTVSYPVTSVNEKTGAVVLTAQDVGALPDTTVIPSITGLASTESVGKLIAEHNVAEAAHEDIRSLISELTTKLTNFLDVDEETTDQLSEVLTLINNNKGTLDSITTNKINVSDIVDNLTTASTTKVLSANQGVAIKALIEALQAADAQLSAAIADVSSKIPTVNYPVTSVNNKTGAVNLTAADVGALPSDIPIPSIDGLASEDFVKSEITSIGIADYAKSADVAEQLINLKAELSENIVSESNEWKVTDEAGNIIFEVDEAGAHTIALTLNGKPVATQSYVSEVTAGLVDETIVDAKIAAAKLECEGVYLSAYATKDDIKNFITADGIPIEYVTETELSAKGYATLADIPDATNVQYTPVVLDGTHIGTITIDGESTEIYAPAVDNVAPFTKVTLPMDRVYGDIYGEGRIREDTWEYVQYHVMFGNEDYPLTELQAALADADHNGTINTDDAILINYYAQGRYTPDTYYNNWIREDNLYYCDIEVAGLTADKSALLIINGSTIDPAALGGVCLNGTLRIYSTKYPPIEEVLCDLVISDGDGAVTIIGSITEVTELRSGLMSEADKAKLNGIAVGATKVMVDSSLSSTSENPVQNKVINSEINSIKGAINVINNAGYVTETFVTTEIAKAQLDGSDVDW